VEYEPENKIKSATTTTTTTTNVIAAAAPTISADGTDPYSMFIFAMNSPVTREVYVRRLKRFFGFLGLQGTIEDPCRAFVEIWG
jgi:hypothetical protein